MTTPPITDAGPTEATGSATARPRVLICMPSMSADGLQTMQAHIAEALPGEAVMLASPDAVSETKGSVTMLQYAATTIGGEASWALASSDYLAAAQLAAEHKAEATLILGAEATSLSPAGLRGLIDAVLSGKADLALPRYTTGPNDALLSSAVLYPLTKALYGADTHVPLALDVAFSTRMAARLGVAARKPGVGGQKSDLLWPVAEAANAGFVVREVAAGERTLPHPAGNDLNSLLAEILGSMFSDLEARAAFWQRARTAMPTKPQAPRVASPAVDAEIEDIREMAESFRNAYGNLQEIWSLVLPPQSLLGLKKVSRAAPEEFDIPADLWARTVYDFVLAFHGRTINRGHLLGAFTPLYLAWVASHLRKSAGSAALAEVHVEETAAAFVAEKPYVVARWRWPDRFNP